MIDDLLELMFKTDIVVDYLNTKFDVYMYERKIDKLFGYLKCPSCDRTEPYYKFVSRCSFGCEEYYLECMCGHRWRDKIPRCDMMSEKEYYKIKNGGKKK